MATTGHGAPRYAKRRPGLGPRMTLDGIDLGHAMTPQDILLWLRVICGLDDDEIVRAMQAGAARVEGDMRDASVERPALAELSEADRMAAIEMAQVTTKSRVVAWRKRHRHMSWDELRILFVGLRETDDDR